MTKLPEIVEKAWENREDPIVFATVNEVGEPNAIYVGKVKYLDNGQIVVADNYFDKTLDNIRHGTSGSILFITKDGKSYQLKGTIKYYTDGEIYTDMKKWLEPKYPGKGAAVLIVKEIYCGAEKIL
jgi:predicted pyridoxine 5'-phosphate oxidase superfamily flavin-nucleotide-binding protein